MGAAETLDRAIGKQHGANTQPAVTPRAIDTAVSDLETAVNDLCMVLDTHCERLMPLLMPARDIDFTEYVVPGVSPVVKSINNITNRVAFLVDHVQSINDRMEV